MLPRDARRRAVRFTASVRTVARGAMVKKCLAVDCVGSRPQRAVEFPLRGGRGECGARNQEPCARDSQSEILHVSDLMASPVSDVCSVTH